MKWLQDVHEEVMQQVFLWDMETWLWAVIYGSSK